MNRASGCAYLISPLLRLLSISRAWPPSNMNSSGSRLVERRLAALVGSGGMGLLCRNNVVWLVIALGSASYLPLRYIHSCFPFHMGKLKGSPNLIQKLYLGQNVGASLKVVTIIKTKKKKKRDLPRSYSDNLFGSAKLGWIVNSNLSSRYFCLFAQMTCACAYQKRARRRSFPIPVKLGENKEDKKPSGYSFPLPLPNYR